VPELPEIEAYLHALRPRVVGHDLEQLRVSSFSLLRTYDPPTTAVEGKQVIGLHRIGKRIAVGLEDDLAIIIHLMVAGRLKWEKIGAPIPKRYGLAALDFDDGTLLLTEAGTKRRASMHILRGEESLEELDPGGAEIADLDVAGFKERLLTERHTLKRTLTDARFLSGIGGAFADEILWQAKLSPTQMNTNLDDDEIARLYEAAVDAMDRWTAIRIEETGDGFPEKVTAFHPDMGVHGKYGQECPVCGAPIQRIVHGGRETNYCPGCQTGGKILADRALSRILKDDWPKTLDELESQPGA
jgi:formamidopyrimidine-DNA glycosylase